MDINDLKILELTIINESLIENNESGERLWSLIKYLWSNNLVSKKVIAQSSRSFVKLTFLAKFKTFADQLIISKLLPDKTLKIVTTRSLCQLQNIIIITASHGKIPYGWEDEE